MTYGFAPYAPPSVSVWGMRSNTIESAGFLSVGPTSASSISNFNRSNGINRLTGDFGSIPVWLAMVWDPDWSDQAINAPAGVSQ